MTVGVCMLIFGVFSHVSRMIVKNRLNLRLEVVNLHVSAFACFLNGEFGLIDVHYYEGQ